MKKLLYFLCLSAFCLCGKEGAFPLLDNWRVYHAVKSVFKNGVFEGTPKNQGTALVRQVKKGEFSKNITIFRVGGSGFEAKDLSLSLRGKTRVTVQKAKKEKDGSFVFSFAALPEELAQVRLYFNSANRFSGKQVKLEFKKIQFEEQPFYRPDKTIKRQRMFDRTVIFPRIQSKYDLIKNYLSSYSAGTGTFVDRPLFFNRELADDPLPEYDKQNSTKSFQKQLESARMFVDGLAIFYSERAVRYMNPIRAAEKGKFDGSVFMEIPPPRLLKTQKMFEAIDATLASPAVFKHRGALVISSYHGEVFSPEKWKKVLAPYRKRYGKKVLFTVELRASDSVRHLATELLLVVAVCMPMHSFTNSCYFTLRSGGKTLITFVFDSLYLWTLCIPVAFVLSRFTGMPILPMYIIIQSLDLIKCAIGFYMVKSKKWVKDLVN